MHSTEKCGPGNYSQNGFEPCTLCPQGEYQENYEQKKCIKCRPGTTTEYIGTLDSDHCVDKVVIEHSRNPTSSSHEDHENTVGIAVGISVAVLVILASE